MAVVLRGTVESGTGEAAKFTALPWAERQFAEKLGLRPAPGTLNLRLLPEDLLPWRRVRASPGVEIEPPEGAGCVGRCYPVLINGATAAAIVVPLAPGYPENRLELMAEVHLRSALGVQDGDPVEVTVQGVESLPADRGDDAPWRGGLRPGNGAALRREALAYLRVHNTVSLASVGLDGPWASTVFYVNLGFALYFLSEPGTRHARNLAASPTMAGTINEDYRDWRQIKGIQLAGSCAEVRGKVELARALAAYLRKYPFVAGFLKPGQLLRGIEIAGRALDVRMYRVTPTRVLFLDNERGFGSRREVPLG